MNMMCSGSLMQGVRLAITATPGLYLCRYMQLQRQQAAAVAVGVKAATLHLLNHSLKGVAVPWGPHAPQSSQQRQPRSARAGVVSFTGGQSRAGLDHPSGALSAVLTSQSQSCPLQVMLS